MPVYNEAQSIGDVIKRYSKILRQFPNSEFVICEDGSTDGTKEILRRLKKKYGLTLYQTPNRLGATKGFLNALSHARGDIVWFSDSDNTHDPTDVTKLMKALKGVNMVIGKKHPRQDPWYRIFVSWCMNTVINFLYGTHFRDINSGFRIIRRKLVEEFLPQMGKFPGCTLTELTLLAIRNGYKVKEIPVTHFARSGLSRAIQPKKIPSLAWGILTGIIRIRFT